MLLPTTTMVPSGTAASRPAKTLPSKGSWFASSQSLIRSWAADVGGLLHPDYQWHEAAKAWQEPEVGEQVIEMMIATPLEGRVGMYTGFGLSTEMAETMAAAVTPDMGRAILALYRSAPEPQLRELADRLASADHGPGLIITASDDATSGAAIRIDGEPSGNVPLRKTLTPGRHLLQVGKSGFATFSKWVQLVGGEVLTIPVLLQPQAAKTGSLLITADVTGMPVFIDGQRRGGTPLVVDGLTEGEHVVEIQSPGEGYHPFSKVVLIKANERTTVEATIRVAPDLGSLRVIANVPGAIISLDGADIGAAPAAKGGLTPGEHSVLARATGYESVEQSVTVIAGRERVVSVRFTTASTDVARILVRASVPDASVTIDGEDYGNPPITIEPAEFGTHSVVVRAPGNPNLDKLMQTMQFSFHKGFTSSKIILGKGVP